jgi:hypothetical protein
VVSLRDVARCIKLFGWFYHKVEALRVVTDAHHLRRVKLNMPIETPTPLDRAVEAMALAIAHCYHFRLEEFVAEGSRSAFRAAMEAKMLASKLRTGSGVAAVRAGGCGGGWFAAAIDRVSEWFVEAMKPLPAGIAANQVRESGSRVAGEIRNLKCSFRR